MKNKPKIYLTFDIDWAPDPVIEYCLEPLIIKKIPFTIFNTHRSTYISKLDRYSFIEKSIHPNFNKIINGDSSLSTLDVISNLINLFPSAKGVRSHGHICSSSIFEQYIMKGLVYESGIYSPLKQNLSPLPYSNDFVRYPHFFQDDAHLIRGLPLNICDMDFNNKSLKIFDFHPVHIFINTYSLAHYNKSKIFYQKPNQLVGCRNEKHLGIGDFYFSLIENLVMSKLKGETMEQLHSDYISSII